MTEQSFNQLLNLLSEWAAIQEQHICSVGRPLSDREAALARKVGVHQPERIRVLTVAVVPFPDDPDILSCGAQAGLASENAAAMTLGYGIYIRYDQSYRRDIWPHEFRHVAQCESLGSLKTFLFFYLKELLHFRYGNGPLEVDAKQAEELGVLPI